MERSSSVSSMNNQHLDMFKSRDTSVYIVITLGLLFAFVGAHNDFDDHHPGRIPRASVSPCGIKPSEYNGSVTVDGYSENITSFPWHATIYKMGADINNKTFICGATIITDKLVITAAHCVFKGQTTQLEDPRQFIIVAGNFIEDYFYPSPIAVTRARVKNIHVKCVNRGLNDTYNTDMAILEIEPKFVFTSHLLPICVLTSLPFSASEVGSIGTLSGFRKTGSGGSRSILQPVPAPVQPDSYCVEQNGEDLPTEDQFCAGSIGFLLCHGDNGSGLTFIKDGVSYLRGIFSVGPSFAGNSDKCDSGYTWYTDVAHHISWIQNIIVRVNQGREVPQCSVPLQTQVCGIKLEESNNPSGEPENPARIPSSPWHAIVYTKGSEANDNEFVCGSTVITSKLVITAAHYFFAERTQKQKEASKFLIATGNFNSGKASALEPIAHARVKAIHMNCDYRGVSRGHEADIAILEIESNFGFTSQFLPICLDTKMGSLEVGANGEVMTPKFQEDRDNYFLGSISVPVVSKDDCLQKTAAVEAQHLVTRDKFCAGYTNGSAVCPIFEGNGLVSKTKHLWYLRGVVSHLVKWTSRTTTSGLKCDAQPYALYTDLSFHYAWIRDIIYQVEHGETIAECSATDVNRGGWGVITTTMSPPGCSKNQFRCGTGLCIDERSICDGLPDCPDQSDEAVTVCGSNQSLPTTTGPSICPLPPAIQNGYWKLHSSQCPSTNDHCEPREGMNMVPGTHLVYICNDGYQLTDVGSVYCNVGGRWSDIPQCEEIRCKGLDTSSTKAVCSLDGEWTSCASPVLPRTQAAVSCRTSYRHEYSVWQRDHVTCDSRGKWEPEPIKCIPVCGIKPPKYIAPRIAGGYLPVVTDFPWHATIYETSSNSTEKKFICGATLITENLLITAAHCVFNEGIKKPERPSKYVIATGNFFRDYDYEYPPPTVVSKAKVKKIYMDCDYQGLNGNYDRDIAILHIEPSITFTAYSMPICLDTNIRSLAIDLGTNGIVAGFGKTAEGSFSSVLQALSVPVVPKDVCIQESNEVNARRFVTADKFCAGYRNGSAACDGDSGGGLTFETNNLWYIRGIVSSGLGMIITEGSKTCDNTRYTIYTEISFHISWIQDIMLKVEQGQTIPECSTRSRRYTNDFHY